MTAPTHPDRGAGKWTAGEEALARVEAAKRRLGDLKAVHSRWIDSDDGEFQSRAAAGVIEEMEHIAYSVRCYLDGIDGPYLREARAALRAAGAVR